MASNLATFLWRTLYLQPIRRHYILTAFEFVTVVLLMSESRERSTRLDVFDETEEVSKTYEWDLYSFLQNQKIPTHVVFGPNTSYNEQLMTRVVDDIIEKRWEVMQGRRLNYTIFGKEYDRGPVHLIHEDQEVSEGNFSEQMTNVTNDDEYYYIPSVSYITEDTSGGVADACQKLLDKPTDIPKTPPAIFRSLFKEPLCVFFAPSPEATTHRNLAYTMYIPVPYLRSQNDFPLGDYFNNYYDLLLPTFYLHRIEQAHIDLQALQHSSKHELQVRRNDSAKMADSSEVPIKVRQFPGWILIEGSSDYMTNMLASIVFAFSVPLIRRLNFIEAEFSSGLAEHQGVMGLSDAHFFWGHFLTVITFSAFESCITVAVLYLRLGEVDKDQATVWADGMDPSLVLFSFLLFAVGFSLQIIMLSWIFPKGWTSLIAALLLWIIVPQFVTKSAGSLTLLDYFLTPRWRKLTAGLFPGRGLFCVMRILGLARDYEDNGGWSIATKKVLLDNITIAEIWMVMLASDMAMLFLAWYLHNVLPWSTGNPQSPIFFLKPTYWRPNVGGMDDAVPQRKDPARFEELSPEVPAVIVTKNLSKVYGQNTALDGADLNVYESKITVLLGHNGAGKTTLMSILTGMQVPTSGVARVCGYNVAAQRGQVRQLVSFCQQTDIFFEDLTCAENLLYFGSLKGASTERLYESIGETLELVNLEDKAYTMPAELSGGMKRRLSIAMAIVSEPKVLILDEPTTGIDTETKRRVWDTLEIVSKETTLLLSSHDMDEADAIADQVIIMAGGKVICSGSTTFLKKACGVGYKISLWKQEETFNLNNVLPVIRKSVPTATVDAEKKGEVAIALNTLDDKNFPVLFQTLERSSKNLGIESIGVSVASMKDAYLRIALYWAPEGKTRESPVDEKDIATVSTPVKKERTYVRVFCALIVKRFIHLTRSWAAILGFVVLPLFLRLLGRWLDPFHYILVEEQTGVISESCRVSLGTHYPGSPFVLGESPPNTVSEKLRVLVESEGSRVRSTDDAREELSAISEEDYAHYICTYPMAADFKNNVTTLFPNPTTPIALPILLNLHNTARLRALTAQPVARMTPTFVYIVRPWYPHKSYGSEVINPRVFWLYFTFMPAFTYCLGFTAFAAFPAQERLSGGRAVQLMAGVSGAAFTFAHFVFDMLHYALFVGVWWWIGDAFVAISTTTAGDHYIAFLCCGPAVVGMSYLIAEMVASPEGVISSMMLWTYFGGAVLVIAYTAAYAYGLQDIHYVLTLFPPYTLIMCTKKIFLAGYMNTLCKRLEEQRERNRERTSPMMPALTRGASLLQRTASKNKGFPYISNCNNTGEVFTFTEDGIGYELLVALVEGIVFLAIISYIISGFRPRADEFPGKEVLADEDVEEEKKKVASLRDKKDFSEHTMLVWSLHKRFGDIRAVRGLYMALKPSECFDLLGVNGAGKTTTFQVLAGLESVSFGDAMTERATLSGDTRKWQSDISYCFQNGGLLDRMNAYEYLYLIGRLRGISEADLTPMVDSVLSVVDLKEHALKECGEYSGGNRRKLSIGAALLGLQPFVFLDEPYAGVDVVSRNKIFRAIAEIKKRSKTCFLLTTHNMDECEFSCDRLTIMVDGQMMCLGTLQHLREKFGRGYRMEFLLKHTAAADAGKLAKAVEQQFPGIRLIEAHENLLSYHLEERIPWSTLFTKLAKLETMFDLEHALVGENSLEQIFLAFARMQGRIARPGSDGDKVVPPPIVVPSTELDPSVASSAAPTASTHMI